MSITDKLRKQAEEYHGIDLSDPLQGLRGEADLRQRIAELEQAGHATLLREVEKDSRIAELEAQLESDYDLMKGHAEMWSIRAKTAEAQLAEAQPHLKDGESIAECLERHRQDSGRAIRAMVEAQKDAERYRWLRDKGDKFADSLTIRWMMDTTRIDEVIDAAMESDK